VPPRLLGLLADIYAFDAQLPMRMTNECCCDFQERRFARTVSAEQRQELAAFNVQRHSGQCSEMSECLADIFRFECKHYAPSRFVPSFSRIFDS
jgi:hypothetical protein